MRTHRIAPLATLIALAACGDGGGIILTPGDDDDDPPSQNCTATTCGEVRIALTDADGDFLSYVVDVVSIRLERSDGDTFQALPDRQRVDFATLTNVSEFIAVTDIPNGTYERAIVRLDYSDAEISVEVDGIPTAAQVVNVNGNALDQVDIDLRLDEAAQLVVASSTPALLQFDFDLEAAHAVALGTTPATVTAAPFLAVAIEPLDDREFRVRGLLASVNEGQGRFVVDLRPFSQRTGRGDEFTVETTTDTACEVNGDELDVTDCLAALADLPTDALTAAQGSYDAAARAFTATRVLAGSSVPGTAAFDTAVGTVVARNLDELVIRGGTVFRQDGSVAYARGDIEVQLGAGTEVTRDGGTAVPLDIDAVSVGQRIHAFGEATSSTASPRLDATSGRVRLVPTELTGFVVNAAQDELRLELFSIDGRDPQFFDFDGTGTSLITEANPQDYQVDTGNLDLDEFDPGEGAAATGFVTPFRSAPPDFEATSITDFDTLRALLGIGWGVNGTPSPFLQMGQTGFTIDVGNPALGQRRFLEIGPRRFNIATGLPEPIRVEPVGSGLERYVVARGPRVELYGSFGDFASRVNALLNGGANMRTFTARGTFDQDETLLTADYVAVQFPAP